KLNGNNLTTLKEGTFHGLKALKQLDLANNPWECDCNLYWFISWMHNFSVKMSPSTKCALPLGLKGQPLKKLKLSEDLQCQWSIPVVEIKPDQSQVVFAGDSITLKCRAPSIIEDRRAKLNWLWNPNATAETLALDAYTDPQNKLPNVIIENRYLSDSGIVDSSLQIAHVQEEHGGRWNCLLVSTHGNGSRAIGVIVISDDTRYCPLTVTRNNKGIYSWPRTVVGWKVELPCEGSRLSGLMMQTPLRASYQCNGMGQWEDLNTESCPYVSHTTKVLEQFSKVNLSLTKGNLLETTKKFKNYTSDGSKLTDPIEIHFITQTIENYLRFLGEEKELGTILVDVISSVMNLPKEILKMAEVGYDSCTRLIRAVETITELTPMIQSHKKNMALEKFRVRRENFKGLTCTWYSTTVSSSDSETSRTLHCATNNRTTPVNTKDKTIEASIQLPASLLTHLEGFVVTHNLVISMYRDSGLFPNVLPDSKMDVTSSVIGTKLNGTAIGNLLEPVYVMLKAPLYHYTGSRPRPVVWDSTTNGTSGWSNEGCQLSDLVNNLIIFRCNRLGYYGLLQDTSYISRKEGSLTGAKFRYSNPAIYIGSIVAITCLALTSVTYAICYASIVMPKRAKHCVVNTWVAIALLCFLYSIGIHQTENISLCQGVGLVLHYLSLCCLLWMAVSASNMYGRLSKSDIDTMPDEELADQPIQKPLLGLYLVGWGIALIICGISGAINLREYAGYSYCFLSSGPALAALFVPAVILIVYLTVFHLLIRCAIRSTDLNARLSEGTQATENVDLELLEPNVTSAPDGASIRTSRTVSSEVEDLEHSQITQLKGQIIILILYLIAWSSGAMVIAKPFSTYFLHEETAFSILYAVSTGTLGLFIFFFYGIARSDVRYQWLRMRCWLRRKKSRCCRTRSVSDANPPVSAQPLVQNIPTLTSNQLIQATPSGLTGATDSNSLSSSRRTNITRGCDITLKVASDLNSTDSTKAANVNLVVLHRRQYRCNNSVTTYAEPTPACVDMFYNPRQSGVARKFFKKQRRHTKNNNSSNNNNNNSGNLGPRKQGDGGATSDGGSCVSIPRPVKFRTETGRSIFGGSGAKVNNTNIHVEPKPLMNDLKNVNILSDSGGSVSDNRNAPMRFVIGRESAGKSTKRARINDRLQTKCEKPVDSRMPSSREAFKQRDKQCKRYVPANTYESDVTEVKTDEDEKYLRNVSQQCSLEYSSEMESVQMTSERSDREFHEVDREFEKEQAYSNLETTVDLAAANEGLRRECDRLDRSSSLYCLPIHRPDPPRSYRGSLNDVASLASSKNCSNFKVSLTDIRSMAGSFPSQRTSDFRKSTIGSERSLTEIGSFFGDSTYELVISRQTVKDIKDECRSTDSTKLDSPSSDCPVKESEPLLNLTALTAVNGSLTLDRHVGINSNIEIVYEDTSFSNVHAYTEGVLIDDDMYLENTASPHVAKKETSV
ncbi:adhesion G protein-coupled receptor A3, partial [Orussus abietinus]|uniref:adhesion G protein-coupled receptor A3 n=1 Tax=Orussus abietinus TaxID=222816 RepID=UPI000C7161C2